MDAPFAHAEQQRRCQNRQRQDDENNKPRDTAWLTEPEVHDITQRKQQVGQPVLQHAVPKTQPATRRLKWAMALLLPTQVLLLAANEPMRGEC